MQTLQWHPIAEVLKIVYQEQNILEFFDNDEKYLKHAFSVTEKLWTGQFNRVDDLKIVMISESPLFGNLENYIYNADTPPSAFFHFNDLEVFLHTGQTIEKPEEAYKQKQIMLDLFCKNGFLILDIFPFALNPKHTKLNYRNMSSDLYLQLLETTTKHYLMPKLELCLNKVNKDIFFLYRYKRLFDKTENHFEKILDRLLCKSKKYKIDAINSTNMSLDRKKLKKILDNMPNNKTANYFSKFIYGEFGLAKTYWLFGVLARLVAFIIIAQAEEHSTKGIITTTYVVYAITWLVAMFNAARLYKGSKIWTVLAFFMIFVWLFDIFLLALVANDFLTD